MPFFLRKKEKKKNVIFCIMMFYLDFIFYTNCFFSSVQKTNMLLKYNFPDQGIHEMVENLSSLNHDSRCQIKLVIWYILLQHCTHFRSMLIVFGEHLLVISESFGMDLAYIYICSLTK